MNRSIIIKNILYELGINEKYNAFGYILSSIEFILDNEIYFTPVTKILYMEIAKMYNTSRYSVERCIRMTIKNIWENKNCDMFELLFNKLNSSKRPTNMEFLLAICHHIQLIENEKIFNFICPKTNTKCNYCHEIVYKSLHKS